MLKMVDGTGIIGVDMICPLGVSTPQPPNYDRVELEGAGMLVLPNSLDAPLERLELGGKTEQMQTTGKNLFDIETCPLEHNNTFFKIPISGGNVLLMSGYTFAENTKYTLSVSKVISKNNNSASFKFDYTDGTRSEVLVKDMPKKSLISTSGKTIKSVYIINPYGGSHEVFNLQVEEGPTAKPYEPYTGGKPSPSQEYPQEIKNVGKWNEEKQKYEVDVKVTGRNLFNGKLSKGKFITDDMNVVSDLATTNTFDKPVEIEPNTDYVISANGVIWEGNINVYDENGKKIVQHFTGKFKTPSNAKYIRASIANARAPIDSKIQMEYGTAMNEFEQYHQPQVLTITSDRPITKWDRLVEQGGEIGWLYQSAINEYRGDASVAIYQNGFSFLLNNKKLKSGEGYCEELKQYVSREEKPCINFNMSPNTYAYTLNTQAIYGSTTSAIKEYLKSHPLHLAYKTETTEFIPLPQSEQNAIRALKTYYPTTVITADGGELDPDIKVTYRKEI